MTTFNTNTYDMDTSKVRRINRMQREAKRKAKRNAKRRNRGQWSQEAEEKRERAILAQLYQDINRD